MRTQWGVEQVARRGGRDNFVSVYMSPDHDDAMRKFAGFREAEMQKPPEDRRALRFMRISPSIQDEWWP